MAITVVLDHPRSHLLRRASDAIRTGIGVVLVVVGLAASVVALPTGMVAVGIGAGYVGKWQGDPTPWPPADIPVRELLTAAAVSIPLTAFALGRGLRFVRGQRRLVLFLRRFGYDDATRVATFAVTRTIGASWRLVTLDDHEVAPVGPSTGARAAFGLANRVLSGLTWLVQLPLRLFPTLIGVMWAIVGLQLLTADRWITVADADVRVVKAIVDWRLPLDRVAPTLVGAFAVTASAAAVTFIGLGIGVVAALGSLPLIIIYSMFSSSVDSVQDADRAKAVTIDSGPGLDRAVSDTVVRTKRVFGPRLVVARVASALWQVTVQRFADVSAAVLIDVTKPSENVLWELRTLAPTFGDRCVAVGNYDDVARWSGAGRAEPPLSGVEQELVRLLDGRTVLAYTADRRGMRRFAWALRARLEG